MAPRLVARASSFGHPDSRLEALVAGHALNSAAELLLPFPAATSVRAFRDVEAMLASLLQPACFYYRVRAPLGALLVDDFRAKYFKLPGGFVAISSATAIDGTDAVAITPDGKVHLAVTKDTYQQLGLTGKNSELDPGQRYSILCGPPDVYECLKERTGPLSFLCTFFSDGGSAAMEFPEAASADQAEVICSRELLQQVPLPPVGAGNSAVPAAAGDRDGAGVAAAEEASVPRGWGQGACPLDAEFLSALFEWLGAAACRILGGQFASGHLGSYCCARQEPLGYEWSAPWRGEATEGDAEVVRWDGFIASGQVMKVIHHARFLVKQGSVPWAAITVWGFADSPVSWMGAEHGYMCGGENDYSVVVFPEDRYIVFSLLLL
eukprot:SM000073S21445  [mRNA]  locus=s73:351468:355557:+ [translate_table: standard]